MMPIVTALGFLVTLFYIKRTITNNVGDTVLKFTHVGLLMATTQPILESYQRVAQHLLALGVTIYVEPSDTHLATRK